MLTSAQAPLIALLTDFGLSDPYVGQVKAVLATAAPGVPVLDLCHRVTAHDVAQAAFFLAGSLPWLPPGSVAVAVVDPGVGTDRRVILLETGGHRVLAPDNGILTLVLARTDSARAFDVTPTAPPASATFHGRDVFAPLAARLAMGAPSSDLGRSVAADSLVQLSGLSPARRGSVVTARVLAVDHFGNVVTNCDIAGFGASARIRPGLLAPRSLPLVPASAYAAIPEGAVGILAGSQGYLELAVREEPAARHLGLAPGDALVLSLPEEA
jgi:S-adenosylmethionine hydrolase